MEQLQIRNLTGGEIVANDFMNLKSGDPVFLSNYHVTLENSILFPEALELTN